MAVDGRRLGIATVVTLAALAGGLAGLAGIYGIGLREGNGQAACSADPQMPAALKPLARGEVAALVVRDRPQAVPPFVFADAEGRERSLKEWAGKVVLLNLWATWCAPCRHEMPALDRLQAELGGEAFAVVAVSIDRDAALAKRFLQDTKVPNLPLHTDTSGQVFQALKSAGKAFGMPTTLLIGPGGCELANLAGPAEWDSEDAKAVVRAAIGSAGTGERRGGRSGFAAAARRG
jgi:thiol-disulfide isomerase/thioredoxin